VAIYRPRRRPWKLAVASVLLGAVAGLILGWAIWGRTEPDPVDAAMEIRGSLASAAGTLEVVEVEYSESVEDGDVVSTPEYEGARDALARSRSRYREVAAAVNVLAPESARRIDELYAELERSVGGPSPEEDVSELVTELRSALDGAFGG
jgi:hypothetical protein